jgi:mRNA interferase RelE/StbE
MPKYQIDLLPSASRALARLAGPLKKRVSARIDALADEPRPAGCKKLAGSDYWRIRIGDQRAIYSIEDAKLTVLVVRIGHRREVYR